MRKQRGNSDSKNREKEVVVSLNRLGEVLKENEITLDQLIKSGRRIRGKIINEQYPNLKQTRLQVWKSRRSNSRGK